MKFRNKIVSGLFAVMVFAVAIPFSACAAPAEGKAADPVVVVIDPGHGGSNIGGQIPGIDEKNATLVTALAMKEELEKYEGVTVYLTRYGDQDLSLSDRPRAAAAVGADFFFSIHFNKAVPNRLYGAEVWIPSLGQNYAKGYACGDLILNELCDTYGLYRRGIKTKVNDKGTDYYGVIKYATELGIPSMIIEHCHIDNEVDVPFFNSPEKLIMLGKLDATGVAKYFGLKSSVLGVDYSGVQKTVVAPPSSPVRQDMTPPETASILSAAKTADKTITAVLQGSDAQSGILYYDYSLDGGLTWSALQKWESAGSTETVTIPGEAAFLTVRLYNRYDLATQSGTVPVS